MRLTLTDTGDGWTVTSPDLDGWSQLVVRADEMWRAVASLSSRLDVAALSAEFDDDTPSGGLLDELLDLALVDDNPKVRKAALAARSSLDRIQQVRDEERARWEADREERERQEKALAEVAELERKLAAAKVKAREVGAFRRGRKPGVSKPSTPRNPAQQAAMRANAEKARLTVEQNREREAARLREDLLLLVGRGLNLGAIADQESVKPNIVLRAVVPVLVERGMSASAIAAALDTSQRQVERYKPTAVAA